ncbi:MAG: hypothetical protein P4M07_26585 [Xanthobacteraceae bacterium]|nr:hypothetical protein [Xanthobacteraceae bacterium]
MANAAVARLHPVETDREDGPVSDDVLVHVRFHPNAEISAIGEKPAGLSASAWYRHLLATASSHYQVYAGGRGFFRIPRATFATILAALPG